ncbi:hypothetical protein [Hymenobacter terrenus]|uniref:hypothetical protein n=1 Tax=Hymenobacter terrenus TaxID=1629124 RepID=UPI000619C7D5|nr:hypothetical protein [Hymenobacter terrenus]
MKLILALFLFLFGARQPDKVSQHTDVQMVLNQVLNSNEMVKFTSHYSRKAEVIYFRFEPSAAYNNATLGGLQDLVLTIKGSPPLVYDEHQNEKRKPVVTIQILAMDNHAAEVRIGLPIEGVVGQFVLVKQSTWRIAKSNVYEI